MPALFLTGACGCAKFTILGTRGARGEVSHVGLLANPCCVSPAEHASVFHIGPPPEIGQLDAATNEPIEGSMLVNLVGWHAQLSADEKRAIEQWLDEVRTQLPARRLIGREKLAYYVAYPAVDFVRGERFGAVKHRRFSCAGFVTKCFEEALGVVLIDSGRLPSVGFSAIAEIWASLASASRSQLDGAGLSGDGPWPLLLPGYLFHSLSRTSMSTPYVPTEADTVFP